ncbi:MAG: hypothetical protein RLZZ182_420 [Pseudomonadota bacterium]|jgi:hypothetical protein
MKRSHFAAGCAAIILVAAVTVTLMTYTVVQASDGDGWMVMQRTSAKECDEGGGCVILSQRQGNNLVQYAAAMGARAARRGTDKDL